ncbi:MAG: glycosyltransferase [Lawsonella clevelandensis]
MGRITRQRVSSIYLRRPTICPDVQLVLCAGAQTLQRSKPETEAAVQELQDPPGVFWAQDMLPHHQVVEVLSAASVFVCPSVYEPLGIVNLEAMACNTAVVASDVGGIPEVVVDGSTGTLVHYDVNGSAHVPA